MAVVVDMVDTEMMKFGEVVRTVKARAYFVPEGTVNLVDKYC